MTGYGVRVWSSTEWRSEAIAWLDDRLADACMKRTDEVAQPQVRPWATVLRAPTDRGPVWMKAAGPGTAFEVGLYDLLEQVAPEHVLDPIATDVERGWIVLPDGGAALGERLAKDELVEAMAVALPQYGQLQRDLAPHSERMLALGVADMRPAAMPARFEEALAVVGDYVKCRGDATERERYERVAALRPTVAEWCDRLAGMPGAPSVDHNDLYPQNVLSPGPDGRFRFYDWGDAVVAHPLSSMLVALGFMQHHVLGAPIDDARLLRLRNAYLEAFSDLAPHAELVETMELACRVGKIARSLVWHRAVGAFPTGEVVEEWADGPFQSLTSLLDDSYLTGG